MSGVTVELRTQGLDDALLTVDGLANAPKIELAEGIGRLVQEQTRRRIEEEKTSPEGEAWKPNAAGTSILYQSGALANSIDYVATPDSIQVGSGLVYARIHQQGGKIEAKGAKALAFMVAGQFRLVQSVTMPARQYLGLSADNENENEIVEAAEDWLARLVQ